MLLSFDERLSDLLGDYMDAFREGSNVRRSSEVKWMFKLERKCYMALEAFHANVFPDERLSHHLARVDTQKLWDVMD